jgi:hypothetical protein
VHGEASTAIFDHRARPNKRIQVRARSQQPESFLEPEGLG